MYSSRKYQSNQEEHCKSQEREKGFLKPMFFKNVGTLGICWSSISQLSVRLYMFMRWYVGQESAECC